CDELAPGAINVDELHDALLLMGAITEEEAGVFGAGKWHSMFDDLCSTGRAVQIRNAGSPTLWVASERYAELQMLWSDRKPMPGSPNGALKMFSALSFDEALIALVRSRLDNTGPQTDTSIGAALGISPSSIKSALSALENRGIVFQGRFTPGVTTKEWCDRRVLARIHRYTLRRLRAEIEAVPASVYLRFLFEWQRVAAQTQVEGPQATAAIIEQLAGFEVAAAAWETEVLPARIRDFRPDYLDQLHSSGRTVWLRLNPKRYTTGTSVGPLKSTPIALIPRVDLKNWLAMVDSPEEDHENYFSGVAKMILTVLKERGAAFFDDIVDRCGVLKSQCELALGELAAAGLITADSFSGLRILLVPASKRRPLNGSRRRGTPIASVDTVGRWDLIPRTQGNNLARFDSDGPTMERIVNTLLNRYGIVFKRVLERETALAPWRYLLWALRRMEARGEVRGGRFVAGFSGEQFALPAAVDALRRINKCPSNGEIVVVSATDPLNLAGVITPGLRIPATTKNQIAYLDGEPVAVRIGEDLRMLKECPSGVELRVRTSLIKQPRTTNRHRLSGR
ncbi:MAG: ATP-dependent Lhr-like helicase, partial [Gammaproteobacteria bacterium]